MGTQPAQQMIPARGNAHEPLVDMRFRSLLGRKAWDELPEAVQRRFSKRLSGQSVALYRGRVQYIAFSSVGWLLAQALRLVGAPLPVCRDLDVAAVVSVSEDAASGGQVWSRLYGRRDGFPQVIHSAKRFAGPTGLEEHVGRGIGMALRIDPLADGLRFTSDHYFLMLRDRRFRLPRWLEPGQTIVEHHDLDHGRFRFTLRLIHPLFGRLVEQEATYCDA